MTLRLATCLISAVLGLSSHALANAPVADDWFSKISPTHPRMFLNPGTIDTVRTYAMTVEKDYYARVKRTVEAMPATPDREACERGTNNLYGIYAQQAAFVWLMEGDPAALKKARAYLLEAVDFYNRRSSARQTVNWYSAGRVCALTAYDWIYDRLSPAQRREVAEGFLKHYTDAMSGPRLPRQNRSNHTSGFYGPTNLPWYIGLAFLGDGLIDQQAEQLIRKGYADHIKLLNYRREAAGDDGGTGTIALGYGLGMYPWSEFNFMHTYQSATGLNLADSYDHLSLLAEWVTWNRLPGHMRFGLGDSSPGGGFSDGFLDMHMLNAAHFYAKRYPERAEKAMYVRDELLTSREHDNYWWPLAPFFVTNCGDLPKPKGPDASWPTARNFRNLGVIFMRSDWTDAATCAMVFAGGEVNSHRHYDQGHFAIFSSEHLTGNSGHYGPRERNEHLTEYFYRTVAANSLLIRADADHDSPATIWGGPAQTLDGGQSTHTARQIAFHAGKSYSYAAVDMTDSYDRRKCRLATRQFVFVHPETFVIFDRVEATDPSFDKLWLLHAVEKPLLSDDGRRFTLNGEQKRLDGAFLLPRKMDVELIGGPGREFYSAGKNRPQEGRPVKLAGAWRIEAADRGGEKYATFLTVLRVADGKTDTPGGDLEVKPLLDDELRGAEVPLADGKKLQLWFNRRSIVAGRITILGPDGKAVLDEKLSETVE